MYSNISAFTTITLSKGSGRATLQSRGTVPLPMDQIRQSIPSVFAEQKHGSRSTRYSHIPTSSILEKLAEEGFLPFAAAQGGSRDEEKQGFTKHLIRLRHADANRLPEVGQSISEIVLLNSHDGTSSYRMMGGQFRLICMNGLVVSDGLLREVRIKHSGDATGQVIQGCIDILEQMPGVSASVKEMQALELSLDDQLEFARTALTLRYDDVALSPITPQQVLVPHRAADTGHDLWTVLNRVQENLIRGGVRYLHRDTQGQGQSRRRTRAVQGIEQNTALNRALWQLAEDRKTLQTA